MPPTGNEPVPTGMDSRRVRPLNCLGLKGGMFREWVECFDHTLSVRPAVLFECGQPTGYENCVLFPLARPTNTHSQTHP